MKTMTRLALAGALLGSMAIAPEARAINLQPGTIEVSGSDATVDLWFFTTVGVGEEIRVSSILGPHVGENLSLRIHEESGGAIGALVGSADGGISALVNLPALPSGDYVAVVSLFDLDPGEFGPTQSAQAPVVLVDYEIVLQSTGTASIYSCSIEGTLAGSFVVDNTLGPVGVTGDCLVPTSAVPAPAGISLLALGSLVALGARRRLRTA